MSEPARKKPHIRPVPDRSPRPGVTFWECSTHPLSWATRMSGWGWNPAEAYRSWRGPIYGSNGAGVQCVQNS